MKKYITIAALLAAGTACANAAEELKTTIVDSRYNAEVAANSGYNKGTYTGFEFQLDSSSLLLSNKGYTLDSFGIVETGSADGGTVLSANDSVVVYEVTADGLSYVTVAGVTVKSDYVIKGTDFETTDSHKYTCRYATVDFGENVFNSSTGYAVFFATTSVFESNQSTFTSADSYSDISSYLLSVRLSAGQSQPVENISGGAMYNSDGKVEATYSSFVTATVTSVPEPSAFGMLAGLGALALVASRRRRK